MASPNNRGDNVLTRQFIPPTQTSSAKKGSSLLSHWPMEPTLPNITVTAKSFGCSLQ